VTALVLLKDLDWMPPDQGYARLQQLSTIANYDADICRPRKGRRETKHVYLVQRALGICPATTARRRNAFVAAVFVLAGEEKAASEGNIRTLIRRAKRAKRDKNAPE
jgi:hypothetical protein